MPTSWSSTPPRPKPVRPPLSSCPKSRLTCSGAYWGRKTPTSGWNSTTKNVVFHLKNHTLVCRLIEGNYPNYNAVIPANNPNKVLVDRTELLNGIRRVAVCSNQATNLIKFEIEPNTINLTAQDLDFSVSAQESLTCDYEGEAIEIGFRSTFLVEILSNIETQNVSVELADSTRAGVFKPVYDEAPDTETLMLLMPMMINA